MERNDVLQEMEELIRLLNRAAKAYYQGGEEIMSNLEYDRKYDRLEELERETGVVMADSPTVKVGYEVLEELPKETHERPMLSLNKTKSVEELAEFAGAHRCLLSWKLDGLTIVLTYQDGKLAKAVTRGNGEVGEVITNNARVFQNIPVSIPYKGELILRGEALIKYSDFEKINEEIGDADARYKNPRNLCSGTVRQLNNAVTAARSVYFYAFSLVRAEDVDFGNSREKQLLWLRSMGFDVVDYRVVTGETVAREVAWFEERIAQNDLPSDGLVLLYDDMAYGASLGRTAKFPRDSIAFKWKDETASTHLLYVEWSASRTGLINPVAVFEPVELEGTTVSRASVHNVSTVRELMLGEGDELLVYKANMIIPQIAENRTRSGRLSIPTHCPVCGGSTYVEDNNGVQLLYCSNPNCQAKKIKSFELLTSRNGLNVEGLSEASLEKFIQEGFVREYADLFHLQRWEEEIVALEGWGRKSYDRLVESVERSRATTADRYLYGLGIPSVGLANAKVLLKALGGDLGALARADEEQLARIDGIGPVIAKSIVDFFRDEVKRGEAQRLLAELELASEAGEETAEIFAGKSFVVTGKVEHFDNRDALRTFIEARGGKVTGSVSKNTSYLINNDVNSTSSKNKKARELGIPILSEQDFLALCGEKED